ncbi:MAG: hypothetical protein ACYC6Y_28290 [Thermoguttaceae bacterium]
MSQSESPPVGHDSFLDILSNIVGILIILVMVTGLRVKNYAPRAQGADEDPAIATMKSELAAAQQAAGNRRLELIELNRQIDEIERLAGAKDQQRMVLATAAEAIRRKVDERRKHLDSPSQAQFDLARRVADSQQRLAQLESAKTQIESSRPEAIELKALPTPLARSVRGKEAHFQLQGRRITSIPLDQLLEEFRQDARNKASQLLSMPELTEVVGPYGGFRLRYTLERRQVSSELAMATGVGGQYAQLRKWTLIPTSGTLGDPVDEALQEGSRFRQQIVALPRETTITIWTYGDSFEDFRRIKEALFELGYQTAGRPLPDGIPIGGSPEGTLSAAE